MPEMTLTADHVFAQGPVTGIPHLLDGGRMLMRMGARLGAVTAGFVAVLVWLAPGAVWQSDVMLLKMALSILFAFGAVVLWQAGLAPAPPVVEVDLARAQVRLVRKGAPTPKRVIAACAFADLKLVELSGRYIAFWGPDGRLIAEIALGDPATHAALIAALRAAGKLA
jgi:hypothetical protein